MSNSSTEQTSGATLDRRTLIAAAPLLFVAQSSVAQGSTSPTPGGTLLAPGVHAVNRDTLIDGDIMVQPGARFDIARGATLTITGSIIAPLNLIFGGEGRVDLTRARIPEAYPEWWGARGEGSGVDCIRALEACLAAHPVMRLGAESYHISRTLRVDRSHRKIIGSGQFWSPGGGGTRIVLDGSGDVVLLGTERKPGSINDFVQGLRVTDLQLVRSQPASGSGGLAAAGLRAQFILFSDIVRVDSVESSVAFSFTGAVKSQVRQCTAFRSTAGGSQSRSFVGFYCNGSADIGLAGGNASLTFLDCLSRTGGEPRLDDNVGFWLDGAFADVWIERFETAAIATGIRLSGNASRLSTAAARSGHADVRIAGAVLDQCSKVGIEMSDTSDHTLVDIVDPWIAVPPDGATAISLSNVKGALMMRGGQIVGSLGGRTGSSRGLLANRCEGASFDGMRLTGFRTPVQMAECAGCSLDIGVRQFDGGSEGAAVTMNGCRQMDVRANVRGRGNAYGAGIIVDGGTSADIAIDAVLLDSASVGGDDRRVVLRGADRTALKIR